MKKIRDKSGETLVETLFATAIIVMTLLFLMISVETAIKMNASVKAENTGFSYSSYSPSKVHVSVSGGISGKTINVNLYESNGYKYYEK